VCSVQAATILSMALSHRESFLNFFPVVRKLPLPGTLHLAREDAQREPPQRSDNPTIQ
jgi:hypothetical protein